MGPGSPPTEAGGPTRASPRFDKSSFIDAHIIAPNNGANKNKRSASAAAGAVGGPPMLTDASDAQEVISWLEAVLGDKEMDAVLSQLVRADKLSLDGKKLFALANKKVGRAESSWQRKGKGRGLTRPQHACTASKIRGSCLFDVPSLPPLLPLPPPLFPPPLSFLSPLRSSLTATASMEP